MGRKKGPRIKRVCRNCGVQFFVKPCRVKNCDVKYCSWACYQDHRIKTRKTLPRSEIKYCHCGEIIDSRSTRCEKCAALHRWSSEKRKLEYRDPGWLKRKHWDEFKTYAEMAVEAECSIKTIMLWMNKHNVPRRTGSESRKARVEHSELKYVSKEWLEKKYIDEGLTIEAIAELVGRCSSCIQVWLDRRGVPRRTQGPDEKPYLDADWLKKKYWGERLPVSEIAKLVGIGSTALRKIMQRRQIPIRTRSESVSLTYERNPGLLKQRADAFREMHEDPEFQRRKVSGARKCPNWPEQVIKDVLDEKGIAYTFQFRLGGKVYDFCLRNMPILIEHDGSYWHSSEKAIANDAYKDALAEANGFTLIRFRDVKSSQQAAKLVDEHVVPLL